MSHLFRVLTSPTATFEKIREERGAGWVPGLIVLAVVSVLGFWLSLPTVQAFTEQALRHASEISGQPMDATALNIAKMTTVVSGYVGAALSPLLTMYVGGLLLMLINLFVRGEAKYMQLSRVALYSSVPTIIGTFLTGLLARLTHATSPYDVAINAGLLFSVKKGWGFAIASVFSPFQIWGLVLLIIGTAVVARRPKGKVATWIVVFWLIIEFLGVISIAMQK